jgi:hypothetical protein
MWVNHTNLRIDIGLKINTLINKVKQTIISLGRKIWIKLKQ